MTTNVVNDKHDDEYQWTIECSNPKYPKITNKYIKRRKIVKNSYNPIIITQNILPTFTSNKPMLFFKIE